jgi:hypothetical protein
MYYPLGYDAALICKAANKQAKYSLHSSHIIKLHNM